MRSHPAPPEDFHARSLPVNLLEGSFARLHQTRYDPLYFGKSNSNRFNASAEEFGVLYVGLDEYCAFIETFGSETGVRLVAEAELKQRSISAIAVANRLRVVDLTGDGLAKIGADNRLCDGAYAISQTWSLAIWNHPEQVDGILYRSRHDPARFGAAIYDRPNIQQRLSVTSTVGCYDKSFQPTLAAILDTYEFGLC